MDHETSTMVKCIEFAFHIFSEWRFHIFHFWSIFFLLNQLYYFTNLIQNRFINLNLKLINFFIILSQYLFIKNIFIILTYYKNPIEKKTYKLHSTLLHSFQQNHTFHSILKYRNHTITKTPKNLPTRFPTLLELISDLFD